jgi:hypothetical protein
MDYENTALTKEEADQYVQSISTPKDLICPITLTLFQEPVLALGDGYTYEKQSILTWFHSQRRSSGHVRSPVTNAYMDTATATDDDIRSNNNNNHHHHSLTLIPNKIVANMTQHFKEHLGQELCHYVQAFVNSGILQDDGFRITSLIEMGADLTMRIKALDESSTPKSITTPGDTAFMACIRMKHLPLCQTFVNHHVPVTSIVNQNGESCIDVLKALLSSSSFMQRNDSRYQCWNDLLTQLEHTACIEQEEIMKSEQQREAFNQRQRQRQETLANENRRMVHDTNHRILSSSLTSMIQNGLGSLEEGYGFFPSLIALQFQGNIPPPPAAFARIEHEEKSRLYIILKSTVVLVFMLWILG